MNIRLVPSKHNLETMGKSVRLHIISSNHAFDLFPHTRKVINRDILTVKTLLIYFRERANLKKTLKPLPDINLEQPGHVETVCLMSRVEK